MEIWLVAGSNTAASTKADCAVLDSLHGPPFGSVATSLKGVESPFAVNGFDGTIRVQSGFGAAAAAAGAAVVIACCCMAAFRCSIWANAVWLQSEARAASRAAPNAVLGVMAVMGFCPRD